MAYNCENVKIGYYQGSERELYAEWDFIRSEWKNLKEFSYAWRYYANGQWFEGDVGTKAFNAAYPTFNVTYSPPENSKKVKFKIKPIAEKTKDKNGKETAAFQSNWVETKEFTITITGVPVKKLTDSQVVFTEKIISDERMTVKARWTRPDAWWATDSYLAGWSYVFRYYKDSAWNEGDAGEVPRDALHKDYEIIPGTKQVKFKIKPIPIGSYFVGGDSKWKKLPISLIKRRIDDLKIYQIPQTDGAYGAQWALYNSEDDGITSFTVEYQYYRRNGTWMELQSTSVDIADYIEEDKGPNKKKYRIWQATFTIDSSASQFRVRVKAVSNLENIAYKEEWSDWETYDIKPDPKHTNSNAINYVKGTKNTYRASWKIGDKTKRNTASFQYEWAYRYNKNGTIYSGGSGSVAVAEGNTPGSESTETSWNFTFTRPDNAMYLRFRVKPVPTYTNAFDGEYQEWLEYPVNIPTVQVSDVKVIIGDASTGMLKASWKKLSSNDYNVSGYEYKWSYCLRTSPKLWIQGNTGTTTDGYTTYDPPENVKAVKFTVKPNAMYDDEFTGKFSADSEDTDFDFTTDIPTRSVKNVSIAFRPSTNRTLDGTWQIATRENLASFDYIWQYRMVKGGWTYEGATGSVNVSDAIEQDGKRYWLCSYDYPENAFEVILRVKPIPTSDLAFTSDYSPADQATFGWNNKVPTKVVTNVQIKPVTDLSDLRVFASWTFNNPNVDTYNVRWAYMLGGRWWYESITSEDNVDKKSDPYTIPENATSVRVSVTPNPEYEQSFMGQASEYVVYPLEKKPVKVYGLSLRKYADDSRKLIVTWDAPDYIPDSYEVEWEYYANSTWFSGETDTVAGDAPRLQADYDSPEEAETVHVRIRPIFSSDATKESVWSDYQEYEWNIPTAEIHDLEITLQRGTARTMVATWTCDKETGLDSFNYEWRYTVDGVYFSGSSGSTPGNTPACTYDAPENASTVAIRVIAVPTASTYFVGDWSQEESADVPTDTTPETAQTPTVTIEGFSLTASLDTYDANTSQIEFEAVDETKLVGKGIANVNLNRASLIMAVAVGHGYRVRARGLNGDGEPGEWSQYSSEVFTVPAAISGTINVKGLSATSAALEWSIPDGNPTSYTIEYTTKERYFDAAPDQIKNTTVSINRAEINGLENVEDGKWFFRIKATNNAGDSQWSKIVSVVLGVVPDPPTTWSSTITATVDREVYLFWVHNAGDSSLERSAELELTVNGTTTTLTIPKDSSSGTTSYYIIAPNTYTAGARIRWRVRTKGAIEEYGDWSLTRQVDIYAPPTLSLSFTSGVSGSTMITYPLRFTAYANPVSQTPVSYSVEVISNSSYDGNDDTGAIKKIVAGETIYSNYALSSSHTQAFSIEPGDVSFAGTMNYTLRVVVSMDSGLTAEASLQFNTNWQDSERFMDAELSYDPDIIGMYITPYCVDENDVLMADDVLSVYRRDFDGGFTLVADNIPNDRTTTVIDPHPALDYARYRIVARSQLTGSIDYYDLPAYPIGETSVVLQWNETWSSFDVINADPFAEQPYSGSLLKLPFNIDVSDSNTIDSQKIEYIGRKHPVSYFGTQVGQKLSLRADIAASDVETIYTLRRLAVWMGTVYVREPGGSGYWSQVEVSFNKTHLETVIPVTINVTRVEGGV